MRLPLLLVLCHVTGGPALRLEAKLRGSEGPTSASDEDFYQEILQKAVSDENAFSTFKRNEGYTPILEHLSESTGQEYFAVARHVAPEVLTKEFFAELRKQNKVGSPFVRPFPEPIGSISPTMLRYAKEISDISRLFGPLKGARVAEIGVGYGGLAHTFFAHFRDVASYTLVDLPNAERLAQKVFSVVRPDDALRLRLYNTNGVGVLEPEFDLCISNYAISELMPRTFEAYFKHLLPRCRAGYLTWNKGPMVLDEVRGRLMDILGTNVMVAAEYPKTSNGVQVVLWGGRAASQLPCWERLQKMGLAECQDLGDCRAANARCWDLGRQLDRQVLPGCRSRGDQECHDLEEPH